MGRPQQYFTLILNVAYCLEWADFLLLLGRVGLDGRLVALIVRNLIIDAGKQMK
jgi:hypothetical protein